MKREMWCVEYMGKDNEWHLYDLAGRACPEFAEKAAECLNELEDTTYRATLYTPEGE